jgi:hypothetical protein
LIASTPIVRAVINVRIKQVYFIIFFNPNPFL